MSILVLYRNGKKINILDAFKVQIKGQRGFAKPSKNKIYCMDIENITLKGSVIENTPRLGYIEGLAIQINQDEFPNCCRREGYYKGNDLINYFSDYNSIGEGLWNLYQESIGDNSNQSIREYRKNLRKKINYTSSDYIPHPLNLKNLGFAITSIAPGKYGTGNKNQKSRKIEEGIFDLMDLSVVLKRNDVSKIEFLKYTLECLHGGVHGINVHDIIDTISENSELLNKLQKDRTDDSINNKSLPAMI